jgi:putative protein kinase ArgK-like GTPase of G3E family
MTIVVIQIIMLDEHELSGAVMAPKKGITGSPGAGKSAFVQK